MLDKHSAVSQCLLDSVYYNIVTFNVKQVYTDGQVDLSQVFH
jgi:hypothetical protein